MESTILPNYGGCIQVRRHDGNNIPGGDMIMDKKKRCRDRSALKIREIGVQTVKKTRNECCWNFRE